MPTSSSRGRPRTTTSFRRPGRRGLPGARAREDTSATLAGVAAGGRTERGRRDVPERREIRGLKMKRDPPERVPFLHGESRERLLRAAGAASATAATFAARATGIASRAACAARRRTGSPTSRAGRAARAATGAASGMTTRTGYAASSATSATGRMTADATRGAATSAASRVTACAASRVTARAASRAATGTASRAATGTARRAATGTASRAATGTASRAATRATGRMTTSAAARVTTRAASRMTTCAARAWVAVAIVTATIGEHDQGKRCYRDHHHRTGEFFQHVRDPFELGEFVCTDEQEPTSPV